MDINARMNIDVKIKFLDSVQKCPEYATDGSAGLDLHANINQPYVLKPAERYAVATGIAIQMPKYYGAFIFARSGLALKHGISMSNGVGVVDSDYTGEIKCTLVNLGKEDYTINPGDRIAQMVFLPVAAANFIPVQQFEHTQRGDKGFGSTGI